MAPVCPQCDNTDYEERDGYYFCTLCNQQSQEMGRVEIIDPDAALSLGMSYKQAVSLSGSSRRKSSRDEQNLGDATERWSTAEGYTHVLNTWCSQLEELGISEKLRRHVLDLWVLYLQTIGAAFTRSNKDERSAEEMSYRDQWNLNNGPPRVRDKHFIENVLGGAQRRSERKRRRLQELKNLEDEDVEGLSDQEVRKRRNKKKRAFLKSFSESFVTDTESEPGFSSGAEGLGSDKGKVSSSNEETKYESASSVSGAEKLDYESGTELSNVIVARKKTKSPAMINLRHVRALFTLAATSLPGTRLTTSDLALLFSSDQLSWATSIQALPTEYRPHIGERISFTGFQSGLQLILEPRLREEALELANFIKFKPKTKLFVCTQSTFEFVLERFITDLCLPKCLVSDILRTFSSCNFTDLEIDLNRKPGFPCVSVRVLALIIIALKYHCGLDDVQEYYYDKMAEWRLLRNIEDDVKVEEQTFSFVTWIRLSKLRLDYLISNDFTIREQFRSFRHVGVPATTLQSMDEARVILEKTNLIPGREIPAYESLKKHLDSLCSGQQLLNRPRPKTLLHLEERTQVLLDEIIKLDQDSETTTEDNRSKVREMMVELLDMKEESMDIYYTSYEFSEEAEEVILPENIVKLFTSRIDKRLHQNSVHCPTLPSSGYKQISFDSGIDSGNLKFDKRYWMSPNLVTSAGNSGRKFHFRRAECDEDFWSHIQFLPDNYLWILRYFSSYAITPLFLLEQEVEILEEYIYKTDPDFFGKSVQIWSHQTQQQKKQLSTEAPPENTAEGKNAGKSRGGKRKNKMATEKTRRNTDYLKDIKYCGCDLCEEIDAKFPRQSNRMT